MHQDIDIPKIYLARVVDSENFDYECIDGKQRMTALLNFFRPDQAGSNALTLKVGGERYTYKRLKEKLPPLAKNIEDFELTFVIYPQFDDERVLRDLFRRLQLGTRLNSGEMLNSYLGTMRDFVYKQMGPNAPFLRNTKLSPNRYSKQFTLAQICINSFSRAKTGQFVRARYDPDLEDFFKEKEDLDEQDSNFVRIKNVLSLMDKEFGGRATRISSRAVAVSAYLFAEHLWTNKQSRLVSTFVDFYIALLDEIKVNLKQLSKFQKPSNRTVLEEFQKYISQASVEKYAIRARQSFLEKAFEYYQSGKTKGKIIGSDGQ